MKENTESKLVLSIKESLLKTFPRIISIKIDIAKVLTGGFRSQIAVETNVNSYFAKSNNDNYKFSLLKSFTAIKKQMQRNKRDKKSFRNKKLSFSDEVNSVEE